MNWVDNSPIFSLKEYGISAIQAKTKNLQNNSSNEMRIYVMALWKTSRHYGFMCSIQAVGHFSDVMLVFTINKLHIGFYISWVKNMIVKLRVTTVFTFSGMSHIMTIISLDTWRINSHLFNTHLPVRRHLPCPSLSRALPCISQLFLLVMQKHLPCHCLILPDGYNEEFSSVFMLENADVT